MQYPIDICKSQKYTKKSYILGVLSPLIGTCMLYHLALYAKAYLSIFNVVHYISFRAIMGLLTALCSSLIVGSWFIGKFKAVLASRVRDYVPASHQSKNNMPTMGGVFILMVVVGNALLWCNLADPKVWVMLLCLVGFGAIGAWDDWCKINRTRGIKARAKFILQCSVAALVVGLWLAYAGGTTQVCMPFFKSLCPDFGIWFVVWALFVMVALSNAVNITDGLDGLAIGSLIPNFIAFSCICYLAGHAELASYLFIPYAGTGEIAVLGAILVGASLGFLWYNTYPAQIFMGDVGALSLGAGLALMGLMAKQECLLVIAGGLFVMEVMSVILQVLSVKIRGKRIFRMAPLHHHFELLGWQESKVTARFGIISLVMCLLALVTLKLR